MLLSAALALVALLNGLVGVYLEASGGLAQRLKVQPAGDRIYLLGNSMFKTGVDLDILHRYLPEGQSADLAYYDGQYTNLWYLVIRNAILPAANRPRVLVWGFRPTYARFPRFRQRRIGPIEEFSAPGDPVFASINGPMASTPRDRFWLAVGRWFPLFQCRQQAKDALSGALRDVSMRVGAAWGGPVDQGVAGLGNRSDTAVGDLLVRLVTKGKAQMAEERVTDAGAERFLSGREAPFFESFVPHITRMLQDSGARQLVVVFKPRSYAEAGPAADSFGYYCDAIRFFQERQVDYIDFVADDLLGIEHYAAGDHYNNSGREYVSRAIGKKLASMLAEAIASKH